MAQALKIIFAPRRQERKVKIRVSLAPFAALREIFRFGCGFSALSSSW
jgi:hypothetical protein